MHIENAHKHLRQHLQTLFEPTSFPNALLVPVSTVTACRSAILYFAGEKAGVLGRTDEGLRNGTASHHRCENAAH